MSTYKKLNAEKYIGQPENIDVTECPICNKKNLLRILVHIEKSHRCRKEIKREVLEAIIQKSKHFTLNQRRQMITLLF